MCDNLRYLWLFVMVYLYLAKSQRTYRNTVNAIGEKIRVIRESEDLTREEFCGLIDVPIGTLRRYETGRIENIGGEVLIKIVNHPRFFKVHELAYDGKNK
ncbi:helix-turn-helix domain-containing protein [Escherichia coli]